MDNTLAGKQRRLFLELYQRANIKVLYIGFTKNKEGLVAKVECHKDTGDHQLDSAVEYVTTQDGWQLVAKDKLDFILMTPYQEEAVVSKAKKSPLRRGRPSIAERISP